MPQGTQEPLSSKICESFEDRKKEILILLWEIIFLKYSCDLGWIFFFLIQNQRIQGFGTWFRGYGRMHRRRKPACFPWSCSSCSRIVFSREEAVRVVFFPASLGVDRSDLPLECLCILHFAILPHRCNKVPHFCSSEALLNFSCGLDCRRAFPASVSSCYYKQCCS